MGPPEGAPIEMVANSTWQWWFGGAHFLVAAIVVVVAAKRPILERNWRELVFRMVILFGSALGAVVFEPAVDRAGKLWYAEHGAWPMVHLWGIHVPLWVAPVYLWFLGGFALYIIHRIRKGARPRDFLLIFVAIMAADLALEIPIIKLAGLYTYYGAQPYFSSDYFPLPLWFIMTNRLFDLLPVFGIAATMYFRRWWLTATLPVVIWMMIYGTYAIVTWPTVAALHNGAGPLMSYVAGTGTILMAIGCTFAGAHAAPKLQGVLSEEAIRTMPLVRDRDRAAGSDAAVRLEPAL